MNRKPNTNESNQNANDVSRRGMEESNAPSVDEWKTFDIRKAAKQDLGAAISLLALIQDNPHILDLVVAEIEKIRAKMLEQESLPKREDFHPELKPVG